MKKDVKFTMIKQNKLNIRKWVAIKYLILIKLCVLFSYCVKQHYTTNNPCSLSNIEIPGNADGEEDCEDIEGNNIQAFADNEIKIILDNLKYEDGKDNTFNMMIMLDFVTGLRSGELRGLKNKFLSKYQIKVRNTLKNVKIFDSPTKYHRELKLISPKSKSSIREVDFPNNIYPMLEKYLNEQKLKWKKQGLEFNGDSLLFTTKSCLPMDASNFKRAWQRF